MEKSMPWRKSEKKLLLWTPKWRSTNFGEIKYENFTEGRKLSGGSDQE